MAIDVRLAAGTLTQYQLTNSDSYLVSEFLRASDQPSSLEWRAVTSAPVKDGAFEKSLSGRGTFYGKLSGEIKLLGHSTGMLLWLWENIFYQRPRAPITVQVAHPYLGAIVINAQATWPFAEDFTGEWRSEDFQSNIVIHWDRGTIAALGRSWSSAFSNAFGNGGGTSGAFNLAFSSAFNGNAPAHGSFDSAFSPAFDV